jgi:carbonic anhydrase
LSPGDFIGNWMAMIAPAAKAVGPRGDGPLEGYLTKLEQASAVKTIDNLMTFPWVKMLAESGRLALHAAYFGVATGMLSIYDRASGTFRPVTPGRHAETFSTPRF